MLNAQVRYQLPIVLESARKCAKAEVASKKHEWPVQAGYCNEFARMAALSLGDAHAFFVTSSFASTVVIPAFSRWRHVSVTLGKGMGKVNLQELARSTPAITTGWKRDKQRVPVVNLADVADGTAAPAIHVRINGMETPATIRPTSGLQSPITVIARTSDFREKYGKLGLQPLVNLLGSANITDAPQSGGSVSSLALARVVTVGPLTLHNVGVEVIQSSSVPPGVYIGMSLLSRFGGVAISGHGIVLSRQPLAGCAGSVPMTFASTWREDGDLEFLATLNQKQVAATWRPGLRVALAADPAVFAAATGVQANAFTPAGSLPHAPITLRVGNQMMHPDSAYTPSSWNAPYQVEIGGPSLENHVVYLTFDGKQPTIAFCKDKAI